MQQSPRRSRAVLERLLQVSPVALTLAEESPSKLSPKEEEFILLMLKKINLYEEAVILSRKLMEAHQNRLRDSRIVYRFARVKGLSPENVRVIKEFLNVE
jgi:hypothetical protein